MTQGSTVNFSSDALGFPEPKFAWLKHEKTPLPESNRISFLRDKRELRITGVKKEDSGKYRCEASNEVNKVTSYPAKLTVEGKITFAHLILEPST